MSKSWKTVAVGAAAACTAVFWVLPVGAANAAGPACTPDAGGTGLSAAVVARPHEKIVHRNIHTGCDIGIYIGAGVSGVQVDHVRVSGAGFQGIFVEKTSHVVIEHSTIANNGWRTIDPSAPPLAGSGVRSYVSQSFGVSLFGVSDSVVRGNRVYDNGRGGIGLMDNGPNDPGATASQQNPAAAVVASTDDTINGNRMWANYNGCALVAATQNPGGHLSGLALVGNRILGTGISPSNGPDVGGLVVAADPPGSTVSNVTVTGNKVAGSFEGGIIVNAEAPAVGPFAASATHNVWIAGNTVSANNQGHLEAPNTAGIIVNAAAPGTRNTNTVVAVNHISRQFYGIWSNGDDAPATLGNHIRVSDGGVPIFHQG